VNIIELAKEAGFELGTAWYGSSKVLERFAALVAEATKEKLAKAFEGEEDRQISAAISIMK